MQAHHYPFIDLAVHASVRDRFANGDAVAVLSPDLGEVLWANGAAASLLGFSSIYDILDEGFDGQTATRRQIESALGLLRRTGKAQSFMMRTNSGFSRSMTAAGLEDFILPDGAPALLLTSSNAGKILGPGARARQIIAGFEGTGTHVAVLDKDGRVLAASSTFDSIGLAGSDIARMIADVATAGDRLVKRMSDAGTGPMPTAIGRLADDPALHLLFAVEPAPADEIATEAEDFTAPAAVAGAGMAPDAEDPTQAGPADEPEILSADPEPSAGDDDETADTAQANIDATDQDRSLDAPVAAATSKPPRVVFDTSRVRDDLNARLEKAEQSEKEAARPSDESPEPVTDADASATQSLPDEPAEEMIAAEQPDPQDEPGAEPADGDHAGDTPGAEMTDEPEDLTAGDVADSDADAERDIHSDADTESETEAVIESDSDAGGDTDSNSDAETDTDSDIPDESDVLAATGPEAEAEEPAASAEPGKAEFRFDPEGKPVRFVWKINREGEFSEISPEFAQTVGPHSADVIGRKFPDLARVFNLDPDHVITDLLNRRDTWSGKTVYWPVQGTDLVTPVDLAALPTYTRDRSFDGFRGFGIVRTGETRRDPEALGLALAPGARPRIVEEPVEPLTAEAIEAAIAKETRSPIPDEQPGIKPHTAEDEADLEMQLLERDIEDLARMDGADLDDIDDFDGEDGAIEFTGDGSDETSGAGDSDAGDASQEDHDDPFRGERPAIHLVETPMRRDSDKIIDLEARRTRPRDGLSPGEQAAFREIGVRLSETSAPRTDVAQEDRFSEIRKTFGTRQPPLGQDQTDEPASSSDDDAGNTASQTDAASDEAAPAPRGTAPVTPPAAAPMPSAFALPARQVMLTGMSSGFIDAIPVALLVQAGDMLIHANSEFFALTGYNSLDELAASGGLDHLLDRPSEDEQAIDGAMLVRKADGGTRMVTARLRSVNWRDGHALLLALSPIDADAMAGVALTEPAEPETEGQPEETQAEPDSAALKIEAQELRSILETATDGVVILDNDGTIRSMNGSACALFNYDETETQRQPFAMLFAHESQRAVMDYVSGLADHGVSSVLNDGREVIGREAGGGFLPLFMTIGRLSGSNGYCAVLRDITQWKRTEEELRTAKRAAETANSHKTDFLARVSHEIRTPLNAIIGFSEMMVEERFGPIGSPRYLEYAHDIGNSGKHVLDIVNDLLDISKIEAGQVQMEFVSVSLNDHLAESVSLLQPMANSQRVIIRTSLSTSVPEVVADRRSIKQIALNLLSNAIRYTPSGGQIVVSTSYEPSGNVVIRIRDTGIGMNRKELEQAMKPFGQVGPGPRQRGEGTGLGLPLTKAMVEANRAQFDIVSAPGEGTLVSIAFPPQRVLAD
ncbi:ATP-binding protein [Hoeflea ulvae]|uniref:histidine kinase n=1 Tax=Hoeflea ulvae TaxID=2983764 RepID=A0ABT3YCH6_9HYPH|nr:ATP-binding protein [Hoeflea ulvae]MCY0093583.1 ATP-binding protein [Hoeflea ulvae]